MGCGRLLWPVEGAFDCIKHDDVEKALLQKGVHPESVCSLLRQSRDLEGRFNVVWRSDVSCFPVCSWCSAWKFGKP